MDNDEDGKVPSQIDVYKFRRLSMRSNIFGENAETELNRGSMSNVYHELDNEQRPRTYAILQDRERNEFSNNRLRSILLIYSRPAWKIFVLTFIFIAYVLDSCLFTFCDKYQRPLWIIFLIIGLNFTFSLDVAILVGMKISKKWRKILNLMEPDTYRVFLDIILALPFSFFYMTAIESQLDLHALSPLVATLRVYRIIEYFYIRSSQAGSNQWTSFLSQYLILFILSVHTWTCVWYLFAIKSIDFEKFQSSWTNAAIYLPTETTLDWYFLCTYWSVMCLTTNALGDLFPVATAERITAAISILLGFLLTTIVFVGSLTSQFITFTTRRSKYVRRLRKIQNHLRLIKMDTDTTDRIIRYYEDLWSQKSGVFKPKLMQLLPCPLQMEICYDLNAVPLYSSLIFRKLSEAFLRRLSLEMTHQFYLPGDIVYIHNHNKNCMICITNGVLELLSGEDDESPMISFAKGTCFGEISLIYSIPARCTVKAATYVECQVLEKTKFIKLMITYPDLVDGIRNSLIERIKRCKRRQQTQGQHNEFSLNIFASKDRKKSSIKCLKDKLRYIQGKTESDNFSSEDYLDENCLDLYILSEHVKKKTVQFTCINSKFPWILESECPLVKYWELYMLLVVFYISIAYPYYIGFERRFTDRFMFFAQIIIGITLTFNIIMTSMTAVKTKKKYITTWTGIMRYRLNTLGFYLDLISIIPFEYIVTIHTAVNYQDEYRDHLFYLCKGVKLVLVWRISSFFEALETKILLSTIIIKVLKYCIYITLLCYWSGVVLYMESCFVSRCTENSWFNRALLWDDQRDNMTNRKTNFPIVTATYFATSLLLSVGYGDMSPGDKYDMGIIAFMSVYGVLFTGYCISEFSAVVTHLTRTKTAFLEIIMTMEKFFKENNMHEAIKSRIMACYDLQWQYNLGAEITDDHWLDKTVVPLELRKKVLHQARFKALTSIPFFQVKNKAFIQTLTETARDMLLPPGEIVYYGGTVTRELYIIESGYCLIASEAADEKIRGCRKERVIGPGNHLGLLVLLYGVPAISTVVTLTHCKLISVSHSAYTSALSLFPGMKEHEGLMKPEELEFIKIQAKAQNTNAYLKHYNDLTAKKKVQITNFMQEFFNNSFIYLTSEYKKNKENYRKSYKQFHICSNAASYLLLPIAIKPDGIFLKTWALIRVISAYFLSIIIPVLIAMPRIYDPFKIIVMVLEIICYIDLYLMLHVAYYGPKNQLIYHPYLTAIHHLKGRFVVDFLTSFPWYLIYDLILSKQNGCAKGGTHVLQRHLFYCAVRMINILQIWKTYSVFVAHSIHALKKAYLMSVLHFLLLTVFYLNFYANILIILSCRFVVATDVNDLKDKVELLSLERPYIGTVFDPNGNMICTQGSWISRATVFEHVILTPQRVYLLAYYWAATSFSGAGFGDIVAQDTTHMLLSVCIIIHGTLFFGYVYARIASLKAMADHVVTSFQENVKHLELFMNREKVPQALKKIVMEYWTYQWKRTSGWSHQDLLGKLHANLNEDAVLYMYEKTLREIPLFENVEYSFFRAFAKKLEERYYQKGYMVMRSNEVISTMYIIFRGKVDVLSDINEVETCMGPGGIFGNIKGLTRYLTVSNVVASRNIDVLRISGRDFYALLKSYPSVLRKVKMSVETAPKDYVIPTISSSGDNEEETQKNPLSYVAEDDDNDDYELNLGNYLESPEKSIAESHGSKSVTSTGNADYAAASLLIVMPHRWFRSSIIPDSSHITFMEYLILILSYVDFVILVYQMAFQSVPFFLYFCLTVDVIFLYKTFLDVHCGYINRYGDYVLNPKKVRKMYFSNVLNRRRDFLANLPLCYLALGMNLRPEMIYTLFIFLRTPQLARISYLFTYQTHKKTSIGSSNLFMKLLGIVVWASILSHINACLFFKLSCLTPVHCASENWLSKPELDLRSRYLEENYFAVYIAALWYVINLLTITGTGDVSSQNVFELLETIIIVIVIKFCTGLLISEMSAMISAHSSSLISYDYGINELRDGLRDMDLSDHQRNKMWDYVRELWNRQQGKQMPNLVHELPFRLRCQIMQAAYGSHIKNSIIFSKTDDDFKRMLGMWMRHCVFFPGNYIVQCGDSDQCIYFIHRGQVEVLTVHPNLTESIYDVLGPEDSFGVAQGLFVGVSHHFSFRARTVVDIVYLKLEQWKYLLDFYPKSAKIVQRKVENVYLAL